MSGNRLPGHDREKTVTFKADPQTVERFDGALANMGFDNRSEALREFIENNAPDNGRREYLPDQESERETYVALLEAANVDLIVNPRLCGGDLAQLLGVKKENLSAGLVPLRRAGYVAQQNAAPGTARSGRGTVYRVKPRGADPEVWKYREVMTA